MGNDIMIQKFHGTTILAVKRDSEGAMGGDGQLTLGETILKAGSRKIRRMHDNKVLVGFAGAAADALTLMDIFEDKLQDLQGDLTRTAIAVVKKWRTDRFLRRLEAQMAVMDGRDILMISGNGDIVEPDDNIIALGSGGPYALAAARSLMAHTKLPPSKIVQEALRIASEICIYTNGKVYVESIPLNAKME
jgi:ATP-dependent HslUV protease subunit HslV